MTADEGLAEAKRALERGDFARARRLARPKLHDSDEAVANEAKALIDRTAPDPLIVWLSAACVLFFLAVIALTLWHK